MRTDRTLGLLRQGYPWAGRLRAGRVAVPARVFGRSAAVVGGAEGVRRFYDGSLRRRRAVPLPLKLVLFGPDAVHGLDDAEHHHRKALLLRVLAPEPVARLGRRAEREWSSAARGWAERGGVVLFDEAVHVIARSVVPWAGVPLAPRQLERRARQMATVVDGFGKPGPAFPRAAVQRWLLDRWAAGLVRRTRRGRLAPPPGTALHELASGRDRRGRLLPARTAGVELLNVLRPTVAVSWFVAFAAVALHEHPQWRRRIADGDEAALEAFAQEVRRRYPFVPALAARARHAQDVLGVRVPRGGYVVLDVHGTDHDPAHWPDPDRFDPERFLTGRVDPDALVPQGGGDVATGHRCPGEGATVAVLSAAVRVLARTPHALPEQDLTVDLSVMPTRPRSGVRLVAERATA
ncbi:cytochrome P450 [Quadrisphaera sp. DSM 44207]|uniref:cytochrome P450 n=1 Tax=Quadrisphaera sp. DSM 44207 TaxID=1881057 RepID=UPI00088DB725|nr:cytochrome P450 [Quadrisphaera sp. DSM 44207]SDQ47573.1 fatty-acid peroxygenase [Quadrisphaera sp. DSM 44207]